MNNIVIRLSSYHIVPMKSMNSARYTLLSCKVYSTAIDITIFRTIHITTYYYLEVFSEDCFYRRCPVWYSTCYRCSSCPVDKLSQAEGKSCDKLRFPRASVGAQVRVAPSPCACCCSSVLPRSRSPAHRYPLRASVAGQARFPPALSDSYKLLYNFASSSKFLKIFLPPVLCE